MLAQCLPILLLRNTTAVQTKYISRKCELFLSGSWRLLTTKAASELHEQPAPSPGANETNSDASSPNSTSTRNSAAGIATGDPQIILSAGIATDDPQIVHAQLQDLHPKEDNSALFEDNAPCRALSATTFDFVTGGWLARQIKKSSAGTAVDQWGWDSREMWLPFLQDEEDLMDKLATHWFRPVAAGYLPA